MLIQKVTTVESARRHVFVFFAQRIDFKNDWKVITVFIGGNDLCDFCYNSVS